MGVGLSQIKHVKLPVSDLRHSATWYRTLFDLELVAEYVEDGEVRGVSLLDRDAGFEIALRQREYCAGAPRLAGFDVFALRSPTRELMDTIAERCDRFGIQHTGVQEVPGYGAGMDIPDPDGTLVRIVWHDPQGGLTSGFLGVATDAEGTPQPYRTPRLDLSGPPGRQLKTHRPDGETKISDGRSS
jgi:catechol 2,3-dioxygenase-like lactoylglutathione lyase family enzyme